MALLGYGGGAADAIKEILAKRQYAQQQAIENANAEHASRRADSELLLQQGQAEATQAERAANRKATTDNAAGLDAMLADPQSPLSGQAKTLVRLNRYGAKGINSVADLTGPEPKAPVRRLVSIAGPKGEKIDKTFTDDELSQGVRAYEPPKTPKDTTVSDANRLDRSYQAASAELGKMAQPVADRLDRLGRFNDSLNQRTPQADAVIAPEMMVIMAGGAGSGVRITTPELDAILGGRSNAESLKAALNKWQADPTKALSITDAQREQMRALAATVEKKATAKLTAIRKAQHSLIDSPDVTTHRRSVDEARMALDKIDAGGDQPKAGDAKTFPNGKTATFDGQGWVAH